uniref:ATP-dependent DNA helicase n=2 Tax=Oryza glaberrima TaxID=4538 RepID=I1QF23_ORYGL
DEIIRELEPGQTPQDRPDLVVRVFRAKLEDLKKQLFEKHILGKVIAHVYVVEFQKRGLPHAHFLLIMSSRYKLTSADQYDRIVSAELPDKKKYRELYDMVVKHMMHGPCGPLNGKCQCMRDGKCRNNYPREFNPTTSQGKDSYPLYRRRNDSKSRMVRGHPLDNRWVVPYNPYLLRMYNCYMNVEVCSSIKAVKYLFKYLYKGHDRALISINEADNNGEINEIQRYRDARWVTPPEALWRIYGFDICHISPSVRQLQLHLPNMHMLAFDADKDLRDVLDKEDAGRSMLTAYFEANRQHVWARDILYRDFPMWFTWQTPGSTSFEDLRIVDGVVMPSFRAAAERKGLIEADNTLDECLTEAEVFQMPLSLRRLFATILVYCEPNDVRGLWDKHLDAMSDDYKRNNTCPHVVQQMVLIDIRGMLQSMGKEITSFPLPEIDESHDSTRGDPREIIEESSIGVETDDMNLSDQLNDEQRSAFNKIMNVVGSAQGGVFFVDGPGGTRKTFLYMG